MIWYFLSETFLLLVPSPAAVTTSPPSPLTNKRANSLVASMPEAEDSTSTEKNLEDYLDRDKQTKYKVL